VQRDIYEHKPIGVNFIVGGSGDLGKDDQGFHVAYLDPDTLLPFNIDTFSFNINNSEWSKAHSI